MNAPPVQVSRARHWRSGRGCEKITLASWPWTGAGIRRPSTHRLDVRRCRIIRRSAIPGVRNERSTRSWSRRAGNAIDDLVRARPRGGTGIALHAGDGEGLGVREASCAESWPASRRGDIGSACNGQEHGRPADHAELRSCELPVSRTGIAVEPNHHESADQRSDFGEAHEQESNDDGRAVADSVGDGHFPNESRWWNPGTLGDHQQWHRPSRPRRRQGRQQAGVGCKCCAFLAIVRADLADGRRIRQHGPIRQHQAGAGKGRSRALRVSLAVRYAGKQSIHALTGRSLGNAGLHRLRGKVCSLLVRTRIEPDASSRGLLGLRRRLDLPHDLDIFEFP